MKVISVLMNKGGTSKTTLITNLAAMLQQQGNKVLLFDMDAQGNAAMAFGLNPDDYTKTSYEVLTGLVEAHSAIVKTKHIDIITANSKMNMFEMDVLTSNKYEQPFKLLEEAIEPLRGEYDYILIDTPPSLSLIAGNVLSASDSVLIPFVPELYAVRGLVNVIDTINSFKDLNIKLDIVGVVGAMVDSRTTLHTQYLAQAREYCSNNNIKMLDTSIPKSIIYPTSTANDGLPATLVYNKYNKAIRPYYQIVEELKI